MFYKLSLLNLPLATLFTWTWKLLPSEVMHSHAGGSLFHMTFHFSLYHFYILLTRPHKPFGSPKKTNTQGAFMHQVSDLVQMVLLMASPLFTSSLYYPPHGIPSSLKNLSKMALWLHFLSKSIKSMISFHHWQSVLCHKIKIFKRNNIQNQLHADAL